MHPIENILQTTMSEIKQMVDVDTIVGQAVMTPNGNTIIPISKVSFGFVSGGGEYAPGSSETNTETLELTHYPFAGGGSAGISITPVAFLVTEGNTIKVLAASSKNAFDKLIDSAPQIMTEIKKMMDDSSDSSGGAQ